MYCTNNPICFIDPTGNLSRPGAIHDKVVMHIYSQNTSYYNMEQTINYNNGARGRADLIGTDGRIWDVKRDKPQQIAIGQRQVERYVSGTWRNHKNQELKIGGTIAPGSFYCYDGSDKYYVTY